MGDSRPRRPSFDRPSRLFPAGAEVWIRLRTSSIRVLRDNHRSYLCHGGTRFHMVYNSTSIINFAQGEFVMLGGLLGVTFVSGAKSFGLPAHYAIPVGCVLAWETTTSWNPHGEVCHRADRSAYRVPLCRAGNYCLCAVPGGGRLTVGPGLAVTVAITLAAYLLLRHKPVESMRNPSVLQLIIITIALSILIRGIAMFVFGKDRTSWHLCF